MLINLLHATAKINSWFPNPGNNRVYVAPFAANRVKLVWKKTSGLLPDINWIYLKNELEILNQLELLLPWTGRSFEVEAPAVVQHQMSFNSISFATTFFRGKKLTTAKPDLTKKALSDALDFVEVVQRQDMLVSRSALGSRSPFSLLITGSIYGLLAALRHPQLFFLSLRATLAFISGYATTVFSKLELKLVHRDLDSDNILLSGKRMLIADWENAVFTDPIFDLATVPVLYNKFLGVEASMVFCENRIKNQQDKKRWRALVYYTILQSLAVNQESTHMSTSAKNCLLALVKKRTPYEYLLFSLLTAIQLIYRLFPFLYRPLKKGVILCYHSVGYDDWRFSTPIHDFSDHLEFLAKHFNLTTLDQVIQKDTGLAITFDDGYTNVYQNAYPLLKKYRKTATVFALGDLTHPNRVELDNQLPLMSTSELKSLSQAGWTIGYHTKTHANLARLSTSQLRSEIYGGKKALEQELHRPLTHFAYPKGYYSSEVIQAAKRAGYSYAFTVDGLTSVKGNSLTIPRIGIEGGLSSGQLKALLSPPGSFVNQVMTKAAQVKESVSPTT